MENSQENDDYGCDENTSKSREAKHYLRSRTKFRDYDPGKASSMSAFAAKLRRGVAQAGYLIVKYGRFRINRPLVESKCVRIGVGTRKEVRKLPVMAGPVASSISAGSGQNRASGEY